MLVKAPCKDCEMRHPSCHSTCERYLTYVKEKDAQNKELEKIRRHDHNYYMIVTRRWR